VSATSQIVNRHSLFDIQLIGRPPIKGLFDTLRFRKNLTRKPLKYAFSLDEIEKVAKKYAVQKERV